MADRHAFTDRLIPFLNKLPAGRKYAIEIRNRESLDAEFADLLRQHQIALGLPDLPYMPRPEELAQKFDPITRIVLTSAGSATAKASGCKH